MDGTDATDGTGEITYCGFLCRGCDRPLLIAFDTLSGRAPLSFNGSARFSMTCRSCHEQHLYGKDDFVRFSASGAGAIRLS
jgi:hypothetical protein